MDAVVLLVQSDPAFAEIEVGQLLSVCGSVSTASNAVEAAETARVTKPDVVVMDAVLPDMGAVEAIRFLRSSGIAAPVLVLADLGASERALILDSGADDCLRRPCDGDEFLARVRVLIRRTATGVGRRVRVGTLDLHASEREASVSGRVLRLSPSEYAVLEALAVRAGRLVGPDALGAAIRAHTDSPGTRKVAEVVLNRVRKKLDDAGLRCAIRNVYGRGYVLVDEGGKVA